MILLDTSIWVDHFRQRDVQVEFLLRRRQVVVHPFVIGELALGTLPRREQIMEGLAALPRLEPAGHEDVLTFIEQYALRETGIGYVDADFLSAVKARAGTSLWSRDKRLARVAAGIGLSFVPE